jgi:hypothetical protein
MKGLHPVFRASTEPSDREGIGLGMLVRLPKAKWPENSMFFAQISCEGLLPSRPNDWLFIFRDRSYSDIHLIFDLPSETGISALPDDDYGYQPATVEIVGWKSMSEPNGVDLCHVSHYFGSETVGSPSLSTFATYGSKRPIGPDFDLSSLSFLGQLPGMVSNLYNVLEVTDDALSCDDVECWESDGQPVIQIDFPIVGPNEILSFWETPDGEVCVSVE